MKMILLTQQQQPQFITDTIRLANDAATWLIVLSAAVAVVFLMWNGIKWYSAEDNEKPAHLKRIKGIFIGAVGVLIAEAVFKFVLAYYTH